MWNANYTVPYLERSDKYSQRLYLDFSFSFTAPKPRYERIITERDQLGRILHSKAPDVMGGEVEIEADYL